MADDLNINIGANTAGIESGSRRSKEALKGIADGGRDLDSALRRLRASIDPTFTAMERYNKVHRDNLELLRAGLVTRKEYNQAMRVAKQALDAETASIQKNSAEGRAALAEQRRMKTEALQQSRQAAVEEARIAREVNAEKRRADRESAAEAKRLSAEARQVTRAAAAADKAAAREAAAAVREAKRQEAQSARQAAQEAVQAKRAATVEEKRLSREAAAAEIESRRQQKAAARDAAAAAKSAAQEKAAAMKAAARASREAADADARLARAEKQAADGARELRASIDPAYASLTRYNQTMATATQLLMQNKLKQGEWIAIQRQAKAQMDLNVRSIGRQNAMYVQLGYQAQDVTASLASGINPLVILAQQGGQTAAALSQMGGTAGKVASFFAGPWGAAIIGATLLLGYLWSSEKEGKEVTKDLMIAEDRRKMTLIELTQAIKDYTKAQKEANDTTLRTKAVQVQALYDTTKEAYDKLKDAQDRLAIAERRLDEISKMAPGPDRAAVYAPQFALVKALKTEVEGLGRAYKKASDAQTESNIAYAQTLSEMDGPEKDHQQRVQAIIDTYRKSSKSLADYKTMQQGLADETVRFTKAKADEAEAHKANAKATRDETKAYFQSREQAIGLAGKELRGEGYDVSENTQFGGVKGNHPGMGNTAHGKYAIDVNIPGAGNEAYDPVAKKRMDAMVAAYQARGFRVLWNGKVYKPHGQGASYDIPANQNQHKNHVHLEAPKALVGKPAGSQLADALVNDSEQLAAEQRRILEDMTRDKVAAIAFEQELNQENLEQVIKLQEEKIEVLSSFYGKESKEAMDANRDKVRMERQYAREVLEIKQNELDRRTYLAEQAMQREANAKASQRGGAGAVVDFAEQNGIIGARDALTQRAAILDEEYQQQVAHENRMYQLAADNVRAKLLLENLTDKARRSLNDELERLEQEHLNRMSQFQLQYHRDVQQVQLQAANITMAKWREVGQTLSQSITSAFQGLWTKTQSFQQAFINMADQMVYKFVDMGAKMFETWFMRQVGMTAVQNAQDGARTLSTTTSQAAQTIAVGTAATTQTGIKVGAAGIESGIIAATTTAKVVAEGIKTGAAVAGAAAQTVAAGTAGMTEVGTSAAVAAAGAYKSTVVIPFIGPVAAPAAAALALAAVLGFGALISAEGGMGEVPSDQLAMVHKKEMILPAWIAEPMRRNIRSTGSAGVMGAASAAGSTIRESTSNAGDSANFYYQPKHTNMGADMSTLLREDGRTLRRWLKNEVRNGGLKFS